MTQTAQIIPFGKPAPQVQSVAPYEARLIARTQQWRAAVGARTGPELHALRAELNAINHAMRHSLREIPELDSEIEREDLPRFMPPFGKIGYSALVGGMVLAELPVNKFALDFLKLSAGESYAVALFFALVNIAAAKCTARVLRQEPLTGSGWRAWSLAGIANLVLIGTVFMVGQLRSAGASGIDSGMTFLGLQLCFYLATLFLSFLITPPSPAAEQLNLRRDLAQAVLDQAWAKRQRLAKVHNRMLEKARLQLIDLEEDCQERVAEYRDANLQYRTDGSPSWFRHSIGANVWRPLDLGYPVDEHPATIGALIDEAREGEGE